MSHGYEVRSTLAGLDEFPRPEPDMAALISVAVDGLGADGGPLLRLKLAVWEPEMMEAIVHVVGLAILDLAGYEVAVPEYAVAMTMTSYGGHAVGEGQQDGAVNGT